MSHIMSTVICLFITSLFLVSESQSYQYCPDILSPEHGSVAINEGYYAFSCDEGYSLQGPTYFYCDKYRSNEKPTCKKGVCEDLPNPQNGQVDCDKEPLIPGKLCHFSCFDGYRLQGPHTTICKFNLQWSSTSTICTNIKVCQDPPAPKNGKIDCPKEDLIPGKSCNVSCSEGYKRQGPLVRICMYNYQWTAPVECVLKREKPSFKSDNGNSRVHHRTTVMNSHYVSKNYYSRRETTRAVACHNLQCEQLCLIEKALPVCRCCAGYKLNIDNKTCRLYNANNVNGDCLLKCKKEDGVEVCTCPEGYRQDSDRKSCVDINECNKDKFGCSDSCINIPGSAYCTCRKGFILDTDKKTCIDINECNKDKFGCSDSCVNIPGTDSAYCTCPRGFILDTDKKTCIDINECNTDKLGCSHSCINIPGSAYCTCRKGFILDTDKKTCIDINECLKENSCHHYCNNTEGSYSCFCRPGYILVGEYRCQGCRKDSYWSHERSACVDCPKNSHTDSEGKLSIKDCMCNSGYTGNPGEYIACEDIDECSTNNFDCSHTCINIPNGAYCICPNGFMLDTDNKTCIDVNECSIKNGGCEGSCINTEGSFSCICPKGFISSNKDRYTCDDVNECSENNGGCEQLCINYRGGFYCACKPGYRLDSSLRNCTGVQCPKLPQPHYSHMNCTHETLSLPEKNSYPAGATCTFSCNKGFKSTLINNQLKCGKDGDWKGRIPECRPQSCPPLTVPENGKIHPPSCSTRGAEVKQKCTFSCYAGYILDGHPVFACKNNLTWNNKNIPICKQVKIQPVIKCPPDIRVTLLEGEATHNITVSEPTINMEQYEVHPPWVTINEPVDFQVGVTKITFTTVSPFNETAECDMTVTVIDEEPPTFHFCPDPIKIEGARGTGELVTWDEPVVTDNVELVSIFSVMEPNTTLAPGTYFVEYVAKDSSGNIGTCSFDISIRRMNCSTLRDPAHGKANCMDWMYGKLCNPECDAGYMRDPEDTLYYACDDTGVWEPSDFISECLRFTPAISSMCQDGFEFKKVDATEEEVCIECPSNAVWSATARKCEKWIN